MAALLNAGALLSSSSAIQEISKVANPAAGKENADWAEGLGAAAASESSGLQEVHCGKKALEGVPGVPTS